MNWRLVSRISLQTLKKEIYINFGITAIIGVPTTLFVILVLLVVSRLIVSPISRLTKTVKSEQAGNLNVVCEVHTNEKIGTLARVFNEMISRINRLLLQVQEVEAKKRGYELALIQAQVKPHFLYNALDLIYVLCMMKETDKAAATTKALADFYRLSLSGGNEVIPVREEFNNVKNYLAIQKVQTHPAGHAVRYVLPPYKSVRRKRDCVEFCVARQGNGCGNRAITAP